MQFDYFSLSRLVFALTAGFHIIFPCLIIGLAIYLTALETLWLSTRKEIYRVQYQFWVKIFAAAFITGFITGLVLSYQLDTTFNELYRETLEILVPIRRVELINAMVLEAGALAVMAWGWGRVGERLHFTATLMMMSGLIVSLCCILARNSWMQTPDGFAVVDGQLVVTDWLAVVINPSFPYRLFHMLGAAVLSTAFFVTGISAWFLLRKRDVSFARFSIRAGIATIAIATPLQILSGDLHGLNTKEYQPVKLAAIEGLWETRSGVPLVLFAIPDLKSEQNKYSIEIPKLASLILTHRLDGAVEGLESVLPERRPNVPIVFYSFRIMVALGLVMLVIGYTGLVLLRKNNLYQTRWFLRLCFVMIPGGFAATIAGWCVTEAGRQPWVIYGLLTTSEVINTKSNLQSLHSLTLLGLTYVVLLATFIVYVRQRVTLGPTRPSEHSANTRILHKLFKPLVKEF